MNRRTKIICTLGPASSSLSVIRQLAREGMDIARLNFSHGDHAQHQKMINNIRRVNRGRKNRIKILQDLEGYRIRLGIMATPRELKKGTLVTLAGQNSRDQRALPLDADFDLRSLKTGMNIYIADGMIALKVMGRKNGSLQLLVVQGGVVSSKKGVNIPELKLQADILTPKDAADIAFGIANRVDFVAQSFVRNAKDIMQVVRLVKAGAPHCQVIAKIENRDGIRNIRRIIDACDGIMVARGDMGVSLPIYEVPVIQKEIIRFCDQRKKMDITATQMLESMTEHFRPTRAEVSDVANAILDGSDCVMLSGETASGKFPVESVRMMRQIVEYTEKQMQRRKWLRKVG